MIFWFYMLQLVHADVKELLTSYNERDIGC